MRIGVVGDTHAYYFEDIPEAIISHLKDTDLVVHLGDFTNKNILDGFKELFGERFKAVAGNTDLPELKKILPRKLVIEEKGKRIGAIHPYWGGPPEGIEERIRKEFENTDVILYAHTHKPCVKEIDGVLFVNPGQGYKLYTVKASIAILEVGERVRGEIIFID